MPILDTHTSNAHPSAPRAVNAHIHLPPNFSAFTSVQQAVDLAAEQGLAALGVSNYYDYGVYREFDERARERGIFPLHGLEIITLIDDLVQRGIKINDPGNPGKMYVCGKGIRWFDDDSMTAEARALLQTIRDNDSARMAAVVARLSNVFAAAGLDLGLTEAAIKQQVAARSGSALGSVFLQERHVAQAFQEALFARLGAAERADALTRLFGVPSKSPYDPGSVQGDIRTHLLKAGKPAYEPETFVDFDHARRLVLALGGIPCYPTLADGASPVCPYEADPDALIADLKSRGITCAEFIPARNRPETLRKYVPAMRAAGLFVTAGTEHNTPELLPMAPACIGGAPIPDDVQAIFWEGACVLAAHQCAEQLQLAGFVDAQGQPDAAFPTQNERIAAYARFGDRALAAIGAADR